MFATPKENLVHAGVKFFSYSSQIPFVGAAAVELFSKGSVLLSRCECSTA